MCEAHSAYPNVDGGALFPQSSDFVHHIMHELLPAEAWLNRHDQETVNKFFEFI